MHARLLVISKVTVWTSKIIDHYKKNMAFDASQVIVNVRQYHVTCGGGLSGPIIATSENHYLRVRDLMRKSITVK